MVGPLKNFYGEGSGAMWLFRNDLTDSFPKGLSNLLRGEKKRTGTRERV